MEPFGEGDKAALIAIAVMLIIVVGVGVYSLYL